MTEKIKFIGYFLQTYCLGPIVNYPTFIKQTSFDVYGNRIIRLCQDKNSNDVIEDEHKLESWYVTKQINEQSNFDDLIKEFSRECQAKDNAGMTSWEEGKNYTCYQLCNWTWLRDESDNIIREINTPDGVTYEVTLVKYAKILKDLEKRV